MSEAATPRPLPTKILDRWLELDLSAKAAAGELSRAYGQDALVERLAYLLDLDQSLILTGEAGVGKTALVHELVARAHEGRGPTSLAGKRVLQLSFQRCLSSLKSAKRMGRAFRKLTEALKQAEDVIPFFADLDGVYQHDLENQLQAFCHAGPGLIIGEGSVGVTRAILDYFPRLGRTFTPVEIEEPSLERAREIVEAWAKGSSSRRFSEGAVQEALYLSQRFLSRLRQPRKTLELLDRTARGMDPAARVEGSDVVDRFCQDHRSPRWLLDSSLSVDLAEVEARFSGRLVGQPEAIQAVVSTVGRMKAGLSDTRRPFGTFLFVGPTGVGKTFLAQLLAEELFGDADHLVRINMGDFAKRDSADVLFGDPDDRSVAASRGLLSQRLLGHPLAVVLFDEFEKCHPDVHDRFMQLLDEGRFVNGAGETVSCRSNILIATSNAGANHEADLGFRTPADLAAARSAADARLRDQLRLELLNRFDHVLHFDPLRRSDMVEIARRELDEIAARPGMRQRELTLSCEDVALDWLVDQGFDPELGVRSLKRAISRHLTASLAQALIGEVVPRGSALRVGVVRGGLETCVRPPLRRVALSCSSLGSPSPASAG